MTPTHPALLVPQNSPSLSPSPLALAPSTSLSLSLSITDFLLAAEETVARTSPEKILPLRNQLRHRSLEGCRGRVCAHSVGARSPGPPIVNTRPPPVARSERDATAAQAQALREDGRASNVTPRKWLRPPRLLLWKVAATSRCFTLFCRDRHS